jgi:Sir2- and TIR-associating SLOG family/SIR2-like domain
MIERTQGIPPMSEIRLEEFYEAYEKALSSGDAALFAGAGLSQPAGFVNWKELMREIAHDLGLNIDKESDLIAIAQYHHNDRTNRSKLNQKLIDEFTQDVAITENHRLIAQLPIRTIWTTNYDTLIEDAFKDAKKRCDVKITPENLSTTKYHSHATVFKMHGDISQPHNAVLTKNDYETYNETRQLFTTRLQGDLVSKTFLFLGFSFTDPNIDYILSRIRILLGQNTRDHYCVMRRVQKPARNTGTAKADYEYDLRSQQHRINDLKRYSIRALLIDDYSEITDILKKLNKRSHLNDIFVSGSAYDYDPRGKSELEGLAKMIGREVIAKGYNIVSGFGLGVGGAVIVGSMEVAYDKGVSIEERMMLRPFPQGDPPSGMTRDDFWKKYREDMIGNAGFALFLSGNQLDAATNQTVIATGVLQEFEIAKQLQLYPIPVGATGHAAKQIWDEVYAKLDTFYPGKGVKTHFETLNNPKKSNKELIEAIFAIIKRARQ